MKDRLSGFTNIPTGLASPMIHTGKPAGTATVTPIDGFQNIVDVVHNVTAGIFDVSTALVALMIIIAGIYLMINQDSSWGTRTERLGFLKAILTGYAIIFAGNFLVQILTTSLQSGGIHPA